MVDNIGIVTASIETIAVASLLLVGILLNFRHRVYLPVIKGFEMSAAGLDIILEMQISRRIVVSGSDSGWKSVARMVTRHLVRDTVCRLDKTKIFTT